MKNEESLKSKTLSGVKLNSLRVFYKSTLDLVSRLVLIRILAPEIFGLMTYAYMVTGFVGKFATISGQSAIIQKKGDKINDFIDVVFTIELFLSVIAAIVLFFSAPFLMRQLRKPELTFFVQMISLTMPLVALNLPISISIRNLDFKRANISPSIVTPVNIIVTLLLAILGYGIWSFFWGTLISSIVSIFIIWEIIPYKPKVRFNRKISNGLLKFGLPLTCSGILAYFYWNVDDFIVGTMLGAQQLGYYWIAFKVPHYFLSAQAVISEVVFPAFSKIKDDEQLRRAFALVTKYSAMLILLPCSIALSLGRPMVKYLFGERWLPATVPFQIFMVLVTVRTIFGYWLHAYISKKGKSQIVLYLTSCNAVSIVIIGYWLTRYYGIIGMSVAVLVTILFTMFIAIINIRKIIAVNYTKILLLPSIAFILTLLMGLFVRDVAAISIYSFIGTILFLILFYVSCIYILDRRSVSEIASVLALARG